MLVQPQCNEMQELQTCCQELFLHLNPVYVEIVTGQYHYALKVDLMRCGLGLPSGCISECSKLQIHQYVAENWHPLVRGFSFPV